MLKRRWIFFVGLFIFILFLAKNPFSTRTLIPNFDPFPDASYYLNPALSFLQGHGLNMYREGRSLVPGVGPLYSLSLIPFFILNPDPRMFYFANVLFSLLSFYLFYRIILRLLPSTNDKQLLTNHSPLTTNHLITFFALFLYATNFFLSWYPTLPMAENLQHLIFLAGIYLFLIPISKKNAFFAAFIAISFSLVKYASFPMAITYFVLYLIKIVVSSLALRRAQGKLKSGNFIYPLLIFLASFFIFVGLYLGYDVIYKQGNFINTFRGETTKLSKQPLPTTLDQRPTTKKSVTVPGYFAFSNIPIRAARYSEAFTGGSNTVLWDSTPLMPRYIAIVSLLGVFGGLFFKDIFFLSFSLISLMAGQTLFMTTFQTFDVRYVFNIIPTLLIGFVMFWNMILISLSFQPKWRNLIVSIILIFLFLFYSLTNVMSWKKIIMTNLRYAEVPWYYLSVLKLNTDFPDVPKTPEKKPVVISSMLPYYIDFFSNKHYSLLPLDKTQDLMWYANEVWGKQDYSDLNKLYRSYIDKGYPVYFFSYYKGSRFTDEDVKKDFTLTLVSEGCFKTCNLYKLVAK